MNPPQTSHRTLVAIPAYSGQLDIRTADGLIASRGLYQKIIWASQNCQISSARNSIACLFLEDKEYDQLVMIDTDIVFSAQQFEHLVTRDHERYPVLAGIYTQRSNTGKVCFVPLPEFPPPDDDGVFRCRRIATGFMRITRDCLLGIQRHFPTRYYMDQGRQRFDFFGDGLMPDGVWMTDDYAFCERATAAGFSIHGDSTIQLGHMGTACYQANVKFGAGPEEVAKAAEAAARKQAEEIAEAALAPT